MDNKERILGDDPGIIDQVDIAEFKETLKKNPKWAQLWIYFLYNECDEACHRYNHVLLAEDGKYLTLPKHRRSTKNCGIQNSGPSHRLVISVSHSNPKKKDSHFPEVKISTIGTTSGIATSKDSPKKPGTNSTKPST